MRTVAVEVLGEGRTVDSASTSVGGASAAGTDRFKLKHGGGQSYDVVLTVTDATGNGAGDERTVSS